MRKADIFLVAASAVAALTVAVWRADARPAAARPAQVVMAEMQARDSLRPLSAFSAMADSDRRSLALFAEVGKVIAHPRCANCHPVDRPVQGDDRHPHMPTVERGADGHGHPAMPCASCHTDRNVWVGGDDVVTVPGDPKWALAPASMAWQGKSLGDICRQLKDPARNGGKTLAQIQEHMAHDELVAWGWAPGAGRAPAPGTQAQLGELFQAWIDSGARCPKGGPVVPGPAPGTM